MSNQFKFLIFCFLIPIFAAARIKVKKEDRFKLAIEDVTYKAYEPNILDYNLTVVNMTFDINLHFIRTFNPILFIKVDVLRKGKPANIVKETVDFCTALNAPSPAGIVIKLLIEKGATSNLKCPLKPGYHAVKGCDIAANRFIWSLPQFPFKIFVDVFDKKTKLLLSKNTISGRIQHI